MAIGSGEVSGSDRKSVSAWTHHGAQAASAATGGTSPAGTVGVGGQTAQTQTTPASRACAALRCTSPEEVFVIANALAALFASRLNQTQLQTLINMLSLLVAGLSTIVTQQQICQGVEVIQTPVE